MGANDSENRKSRTVDQLVQTALTEPDEGSAWEAVAQLHLLGNADVLDRAIALGRSVVSRERRLGADILGQLGVPERTFPRQCGDTLLTMLETEAEDAVLQSIFVAFGHLRDPKVIEPATRHANHSNADVRQAVALALTGHADPLAIQGLIALTKDPAANVRDWATFGLGSQFDGDTPEIREALAARLEDADDDTRGEALVGLARRGDPRAAIALRKELASARSTVLLLEAAELIGDPDLLERAKALLAARNDDSHRL